MSDAYADTLALARQLVACRSVTPDDGGAIEIVAARLTRAGFICERLDRGPVRNLWARRGTTAPLVCLAGHVDVVAPGPVDRWTSDPFIPAERGGCLYGRGTGDMKTSVAAMVTAAERVVAGAPLRGSLALVLTSDEEGAAVDGTAAVVNELHAREEWIDACIVGEPTSAVTLGDTIKNGRRGSLNGVLTVTGTQAHIAYRERGRNPIHAALPALAELAAIEWDRGNEYFQPTSFQFSNIHAGTGSNNTTPGTMEVLFNFRFSTECTAEHLKARVHAVLDSHAVDYTLDWQLSGNPFLSPRGGLVDAVSAAVTTVTGVTPQLSTTGGTSDGRFLATVSREVVEFGPVGRNIHGLDEHIRLDEIEPLTRIFETACRTLLTSDF